jgi:DNA-directed RNA polymerase subunit P
MIYYKCGRCGAVFTEEDVKKSWGTIHCPYCGYEIVYKVARKYRLVKAI